MEDLSKILLREEAIEPLFQMTNMIRMSRMGHCVDTSIWLWIGNVNPSLGGLNQYEDWLYCTCIHKTGFCVRSMYQVLVLDIDVSEI